METKVYAYTCSVCKGVDYKLSHFRKIVKRILVNNNSQGWGKYGYKFHETPTETNTQTKALPDTLLFPVIHVKLASNTFISTHGPSFAGMSIANCGTSVIHINYNRWMTGAKNNDSTRRDPVRTQMSLDSYRSYVIRHEIGHILWGCTDKDHKKDCVLGFAPIMMQQTNGVGESCRPNPYPLINDVPPAQLKYIHQHT